MSSVSGENSIVLFNLFNLNFPIVGFENLEELFRSFFANLQPMEASVDLGPPSCIVIYNIFIMMKLGKMDM